MICWVHWLELKGDTFQLKEESIMLMEMMLLIIIMLIFLWLSTLIRQWIWLCRYVNLGFHFFGWVILHLQSTCTYWCNKNIGSARIKNKFHECGTDDLVIIKSCWIGKFVCEVVLFPLHVLFDVSNNQNDFFFAFHVSHRCTNWPGMQNKFFFFFF